MSKKSKTKPSNAKKPSNAQKPSNAEKRKAAEEANAKMRAERMTSKEEEEELLAKIEGVTLSCQMKQILTQHDLIAHRSTSTLSATTIEDRLSKLKDLKSLYSDLLDTKKKLSKLKREAPDEELIPHLDEFLLTTEDTLRTSIDTTQFNVLNSLNSTKFTLPELERNLKELEIDIPNFRLTLDGVELTITPNIIAIIHTHWKESPATAQKILRSMLKKGLELNHSTYVDNALLYAIQYSGDIGFLRMLLNNGADVNLHINLDSLSTKFSVFCIALSFSNALNLDLLSTLLEYGANPSLLTTQSETFPQAQDLVIGEHLSINPAFSTLSPEEQSELLDKINNLINDFFLNQLTSTTPPEASIDTAQTTRTEDKLENSATELTSPKEDLETDSTTDKTIDESASSSEELIEDASPEQTGAAAEESSDDEIAPQKVRSWSEVFDQYLEYIEQASKNSTLPEQARNQHQFTIKVLNYLQTQNSPDLQMEVLISLRNGRFQECLDKVLDSIDYTAPDSTNIANQINHAFHQWQKAPTSTNAMKSEPVQEMVLAEGVYKVEGAERIFIYVAQDLLQSLPPEQKTTVERILQNPKFIKSKSKAQNGIKHYGDGSYKIKTAKTDDGIIATKIYIDEVGNTLVIFDEIYSHKDLNRSKTEVETIQVVDITGMIFAPCSSESTGSSSGNDSDDFNAPPPPEPFSTKEIIEMQDTGMLQNDILKLAGLTSDTE